MCEHIFSSISLYSNEALNGTAINKIHKKSCSVSTRAGLRNCSSSSFFLWLLRHLCPTLRSENYWSEWDQTPGFLASAGACFQLRNQGWGCFSPATLTNLETPQASCFIVMPQWKKEANSTITISPSPSERLGDKASCRRDSGELSPSWGQ